MRREDADTTPIANEAISALLVHGSERGLQSSEGYLRMG